MALVLRDRVKETSTTTGTGTYTLAGAVTGFEAFSSVGNGNTTYYACTDGTDFEVGIGTYTASGTTLARTTILQGKRFQDIHGHGRRNCQRGRLHMPLFDRDHHHRPERSQYLGGVHYCFGPANQRRR